MKKILSVLFVCLFLVACGDNSQPPQVTVSHSPVQTVIGPQILDLQQTLNLFRQSAGPADFQDRLNNSPHLVDLDEDGNRDPLFVSDYFKSEDLEGFSSAGDRRYVISSLINNGRKIPLAMVVLHRRELNVGANRYRKTEIIGDKDFYGRNNSGYYEATDLIGTNYGFYDFAFSNSYRPRVTVWTVPSTYVQVPVTRRVSVPTVIKRKTIVREVIPNVNPVQNAPKTESVAVEARKPRSLRDVRSEAFTKQTDLSEAEKKGWGSGSATGVVVNPATANPVNTGDPNARRLKDAQRGAFTHQTPLSKSERAGFGSSGTTANTGTVTPSTTGAVGGTGATGTKGKTVQSAPVQRVATPKVNSGFGGVKTKAGKTR